MSFSPRLIAFALSFLIAAFTTTFLTFVNGVSSTILFVAAISSWVVSFFLILYTIEIIVFREIDKMYRTIHKLKLKDFSIARKALVAENNPLKKLNDEIFVYVAKKQKEIEELRKLEQFRREFLADVSHELKTPIFAAQGFVHTLLDGAMYDEAVSERFLKKAAKSLDGLDALVKDLVNLSQMETGVIKMDIERINMRLLVEEVFEKLEKIAADHDVKLKVKPEGQEEVWVMADLLRMEQVMTNLIENGIKYNTEGGKVVVHFDEQKKHYEVSVRDNGPGIPPEHLPRIFERFYRIDKSRSKERGGTGLGLAIVKHIVNRHGSKVAVLSKVDKGTTFTFKLEKAD
jgi:two-component system phosphate regulon sensor histidine kinase PhoR